MLAGGASRRMGGDPKVLLPISGEPMGRVVARALEHAGAEPVVLVGGDPAWAQALGLDHVVDRWPGEGPLGGLATALVGAMGAGSADPTDVVVVAACDQPWLDRATLTRLVAALAADPAVEAAAGIDPAGRVQPLPSAWRRSAGRRVADLVDAGERRLDAALASDSTAWIRVETETIADVDEPADLARRPRLGPPDDPVDGGRRSSP